MTRKLALFLLLFLGSARPQDIVNRKFIALSTFDASMTLLDAASSTHWNKSRNCQELNPMFGSNPSAGRYYGQMIATTAGLQFLSYELKKHHSKLWKFPMLIDGGAHVVGSVQNFHNCY